MTAKALKNMNEDKPEHYDDIGIEKLDRVNHVH